MARGKPFEKGNKGKPKGAVSDKTKFWNELSEFITCEGAEKYKQEIMQLEGKEFVQAFNNILEFFKPKLARQNIDLNHQATIFWNEEKTYGPESE